MFTDRPAANTERNKRLSKLGGCTVLGRDLADARLAVNIALGRHRHAQMRAASRHPSQFERKPHSTRMDVFKAVERVRMVERQIEARYGHSAPMASPAPAYLMAAE